MVERLPRPGQGAPKRLRVLAAVPAWALALSAVGVLTGTDAVVAHGTSESPVTAVASVEVSDSTSSAVKQPLSSLSDPHNPETAAQLAVPLAPAAAATSVATTSKSPRRAAVRGSRYLTAAVNIRTRPSLKARVVTVLPRGSKVQITKATHGQFTQIVFQSKTRYAATRYLSRTKPKSAKARTSKPAPKAPASRAKCRSGSSVERRLTSDAVLVHRSLCARFPQISAFGGYRAGSGSYHGSGRAVDAMIGNRSTGWKMANYVRKNRKALGVSEVIYARKIWTVQRSGEGWRSMSDRGSVSANHLDHVHVSVYGSSAR